MIDGDNDIDSVRQPPPPERGKKYLIAAIVLVFLFCTAFALYLIIAGFYWKPLPSH